MLLADLLADIDFGSDVAEHEQSNLPEYFIRTQAFEELVSDRCDLILGFKGLGKTALYESLTNPEIRADRLKDTDIIEALDDLGTVALRDLLDRPGGVTKRQLEHAWWMYISSEIGAHILEHYGRERSNDPDFALLRQTLEGRGLHQSTEKAPRLASIFSWERSNALEGLTEVAPLGLSRGAADELSPVLIYNKILDLEVGILGRLGRRAWICFDRLDEVFGAGEYELLALRALLEAHRDIARLGQGWLCSKLFLRSDIMDRVTRGAKFINLTHYRTHKLIWNRRSIVDLVTRRVLRSEQFRTAFHIGEGNPDDPAIRLQAWDAIFPKRIQSKASLDWIVTRTADGSGAFNPRNVLTLLRICKDRQLQTANQNGLAIGTHIFTNNNLQGALAQLSTQRLEDTVLAEASHLRSWIERLVGKPNQYPSDVALAKTLGIAPASDEFRMVAGSLLYVGVLNRPTPTSYGVAHLYRVALRSKNPSQLGQA